MAPSKLGEIPLRIVCSNVLAAFFVQPSVSAFPYAQIVSLIQLGWGNLPLLLRLAKLDAPVPKVGSAYSPQLKLSGGKATEKVARIRKEKVARVKPRMEVLELQPQPKQKPDAYLHRFKATAI